ncbi:hypothetical protein CVT25_012392 [Psilocybe cyanescens]|uniref:Cyanovirin-N domain-containing protein n=1 Tax=Psilocybe cyanescens TaxID=93625 RepID=A0A409X7T9_PSICY|nr:hypothetical protein CVT25_012392 [Psilocybe cyanescens]
MFTMSLKSSTFFLFSAFAIVSARVCNNKHIIETKPLTLGSGDVIQIQRFNCSSDTAPVAHPKGVVKRDTFELNLLAASQCTEPNCFCGVPCFLDACRAVTQPIQGAHCTQLAAQLSNTPGTITIPANEGLGFILQSCEYTVFGGSATQASQYCFNDMGSAATNLFNVCGTLQGDCKATQGGQTLFVDQISL